MVIQTRDYLGYGGLIPFLALALYIVFYDNSPFTVLVFSSYSAVISSLIAGSLWGQALHIHTINRAALFVLSNILSLVAWLSVIFILAGHIILGVSILLINNIILWLVEKYFLWNELEFESLDRLNNYKKLRGHLTFVVAIAHIITIFSLISNV